MQAAWGHLQNQSGKIREEDEARLLPLVYEHLNVLGRYSFTLNKQVKNGQILGKVQVFWNIYYTCLKP